MSLRTKLYVGFLIMIILVAFTGAMAIRAFWRTNKLVENTRLQVSNVSKILVPANQLVTQVYTDVNQASLYFYAYSFNRLGEDYDNGMSNVGQIRDRIGKIEQIMKEPRATMLAKEQGALQQAKTGIETVDSQARNLKASMTRADELQTRIDSSLADIAGVLDTLYDRVFVEVEDEFSKKEAAGMSPARQRVMQSWRFLDDLFNAVAQAELQFWKGRGKYGSEAAAAFKEVEKNISEQRDAAKAFMEGGSVTAPEARAGFEDLLTKLTSYAQLVNDFSAEWNRNTELNAEVTKSSEMLLDTFDNLDVATSELTSENTDLAYTGTVAIDAIVDRSTIGSFIILMIAVVIGGLLAFFITRGIVNPINAVITSLSRGEEVIGEAASQISAASHDLSESVTEQAASLEETSSALEQVSAMTKASAANAGNTNDNTRKTAELVKDGATDMKEMSAAMSKINEQADRISNIIKTIEEIAFQTNLLALNAAVEAARAGEAGKGFAVVADEVRNLSGRSAQAAKDTAELITATVESVRNGSGILERLNGSYGEIEHGIDNIGGLIGQIANAADEQSQGVEQINTAMSQMGRITQQNAAGAEESSASVENLEEQITDLRDNIVSLQKIIYGKRLKRAGARLAARTAPPARQLSGPMRVTPDLME